MFLHDHGSLDVRNVKRAFTKKVSSESLNACPNFVLLFLAGVLARPRRSVACETLSSTYWSCRPRTRKSSRFHQFTSKNYSNSWLTCCFNTLRFIFHLFLQFYRIKNIKNYFQIYISQKSRRSLARFRKKSSLRIFFSFAKEILIRSKLSHWPSNVSNGWSLQNTRERGSILLLLMRKLYGHISRFQIPRRSQKFRVLRLSRIFMQTRAEPSEKQQDSQSGYPELFYYRF